MWNPGKWFAEGQVLKITFAKDNRHIQGYAVIAEMK
jgi:hypothetical protein